MAEMESLKAIMQRVVASRAGDTAAPLQERNAEPVERPGCEKCAFTGWYGLGAPVGHPDFGKLFECSCQDTPERRARRYAALLRYSQLPSLNRPSFQDLQPVPGYPDLQRTASYIESWCEDARGFLVITGPVGTGKTHCAVSAGYQLLGQGKVVYFTTAVRLLDTLRAAFRREGEDGHYELVDKMCSVDVLVLDDFGKQRATDFAAERLAMIVDARHAAGLITIITTNLTIGELEAWDAATASRMLDRSRSVSVPMYGPDYRLLRGRLTERE